jgi:signal transduction histidine kinase
VNPLRSVGARLSLALLVVVAAALGIVYALLVPSLESNLVDARVTRVERDARTLRLALPADQFNWHEFVEGASATVDAGVVILQELSPAPELTLTIIDFSSNVRPAGVEQDPVAVRAAETGALQSGAIDRAGIRYAEAAIPASPTGPILLVSSPLRDTLRTVSHVRARLLIAGAVSLLVALALGYGGAWVFARRIRRLERAADRIAGGRFDEPVVDRGRDEVGELAAAFDRMRQQLAQLDHARREFIANASHELRTPLFSLGGFIELLADEELDDDTRREFLETMREQVERLGKLAIDLLDLSRMDAGRLHVVTEPVALGELARALVEEFQPLARAQGHSVEAVVDDAPTALADEQRTLQIGRILVENALLHTPEGTNVRAVARREDGRAELAVLDDGPGIPAEHTGQVFERFYRVDGGRASGSGLGLAIARELAELMGGSIEVDSRPGETRFVLILPAGASKSAGKT